MSDKLTFDEYEAWAKTLPDSVRHVAKRYPIEMPGDEKPRCYHTTENPRTHYVIKQYDGKRNLQTDEVTITLTLVHGYDSTLPGVMTFGQDPSQLIPCGCGKWEMPTAEQIKNTRTYMQRRGNKVDDTKRFESRLFGPKPWNIALHDPGLMIGIPAGETCYFCDERIDEWDYGMRIPIVFIAATEFMFLHRECHARTIFGSARHQRKSCRCFGGWQNEDAEALSKRLAAVAAYCEVLGPI